MNQVAMSARVADGAKLHPLGLFMGFIAHMPQLIFPIIAGLVGTQRAGFSFYTPLIILGILGLSLAYHWFSWLRFRYYIGEDDIRIESGVLDRNARSIPYDRIQDVSIEQKLLPRLLGLAEVKFETGGGKGDEAKLRFVSNAEAERLREVVREHRLGITKVAEVENSSTLTPPIYAMDVRRLITLGVYSFSLVILAIFYGIAHQLDFLLPFDFWDISGWIGIAKERGFSVDGIGIGTRIFGAVVGLFAIILLGAFSGVIRTVLRDYGFRLDRTDKGFRRRRGLLTLTDVVMPIHRVQAITIQTGPIRKRSGWYALKFISLAHDSDEKKSERDHVVAPLATLQEIWTIARAAGVDAPAPDLSFTRSHYAVWLDGWLTMSALSIVSIFGLAEFTEMSVLWLLVLLLPLALILWFGWRNSQSAMDKGQIFVRQGWWRERMIIAAQIKVQSVQISQGPLARLRNLATVQFGISGGDLAIRAIPIATAHAIRNAVMERVVRVDYSALNAKS